MREFENRETGKGERPNVAKINVFEFYTIIAETIYGTWNIQLRVLGHTFMSILNFANYKSQTFVILKIFNIISTRKL